MTRIYENPGIAKRANFSMIIMVAVIAWGIWELWSAFGTGAQDSTAALFGVLFLGGGVYGIYKTFVDNRDLATAMDVDFAAGQAAVTVWRPLRALTIEDSLDRFTGWRYWVKLAGRSQRTYMVLVSVPAYPHPLQIELRRGQPVDEGLRRLAAEPVADFERDTGVRSE